VLGFAKLHQGELIVEFLVDPGQRVELIVERGAFLHHLAGALRIAPQIGVFGLPIQLGEARARFVDVKDASSAVRWTA